MGGEIRQRVCYRVAYRPGGVTGALCGDRSSDPTLQYRKTLHERRPVSDAGEPWRAFIEGAVYCADRVPWRDDPAFAVISEHAGLRDSLGGHVGSALTLASGMVHATSQTHLAAIVQAQRPAYGLCLGFGMNALEPYDVLQAFDLDGVHANCQRRGAQCKARPGNRRLTVNTPHDIKVV